MNASTRRSRAYIAGRYEWVPDWQHRRIPSGNAFDVLTPRQRLILLGLTSGMTARDVAEGVGISTVHLYREIHEVRCALSSEPMGQQWHGIIWETEEA